MFWWLLTIDLSCGITSLEPLRSMHQLVSLDLSNNDVSFFIGFFVCLFLSHVYYVRTVDKVGSSLVCSIGRLGRVGFATQSHCVAQASVASARQKLSESHLPKAGKLDQKSERNSAVVRLSDKSLQRAATIARLWRNGKLLRVRCHILRKTKLCIVSIIRQIHMEFQQEQSNWLKNVQQCEHEHVEKQLNQVMFWFVHC